MSQVSIVMPVYNGEQYLREAIESILAQTFQDWELILVDDCSVDGSLAIMTEYAKLDKRIQIISNNQNLKLPRSLNVGFDKACGKYLTWTSDDNVYGTDAIESMHGFMERHSNIGLVYCDMHIINENGKIIGSQTEEENTLWFQNCIGACFLYRADVLKTVGKYDPHMFLVEDYDYWLRIGQLYGIKRIPEKKYYYRHHGGSLTETKAEKVYQQLFKLRMKYLDFLLNQVDGIERDRLFLELWLQDETAAGRLTGKFYQDKSLPNTIQWLERRRRLDSQKKIILYGAGGYGEKALEYFGEEKVAYFADKNSSIAGTYIKGKRVLSLEELEKMHISYNVVISVDVKKILEVTQILDLLGIYNYITFLEIFQHSKKSEQVG